MRMRKRVFVKAAGIVSRGVTGNSPPSGSSTLEGGRSLADERADPFCEVLRTRQSVLELGLEEELLLELRVEDLVERLLGAGVGARRAGREALGHRLGLLHQLVVGV